MTPTLPLSSCLSAAPKKKRCNGHGSSELHRRHVLFLCPSPPTVCLWSTVCRVTRRLWVEEFPNRIGPVTSRPICSVRRPPGHLPSPTEFTLTMTTTCSPVTQQFSTHGYTFWVLSVALPSESSLVTRVIVGLGHARPFLLQILRRHSTFFFFYASRSVCWSCDVLVKECKNMSYSYSDMVFWGFFFEVLVWIGFFSTQQIILES